MKKGHNGYSMSSSLKSQVNESSSSLSEEEHHHQKLRQKHKKDRKTKYVEIGSYSDSYSTEASDTLRNSKGKGQFH